MLIFRVKSGQIRFRGSTAPASPVVGFGIHVVIVAIEILAFIAVLRIVKQEDKAHKMRG